jgi:hypothetical protein
VERLSSGLRFKSNAVQKINQTTALHGLPYRADIIVFKLPPALRNQQPVKMNWKLELAAHNVQHLITSETGSLVPVIEIAHV